MRARDGERGQITLVVVVLALALLATIGLVLDGSAKLRAGSEAQNVAAEAARAAAGRVDPAGAYTGGGYRLDTAAAVGAARSYLSASGHRGAVTAAGPRTIRVSVTVDRPTTLLALIGIGHISATGTATADLTPGVGTPLASLGTATSAKGVGTT